MLLRVSHVCAGTSFFAPALLNYDSFANSLELARTGFWIVIVVAVAWVSIAAFLQGIASSDAQDLRDLGAIPKVDVIVPLLSNTLFFTIGMHFELLPALKALNSRSYDSLLVTNLMKWLTW